MLTESGVKALKPGPNVRRKYEASKDATTKGFGVMVTPAGTKAFFLAFTSPTTGKRRFLDLGGYPGTKLVDARDAARDARKLIRQGIDPKDRVDAERAERKAAQKARKAEAAATVKALFDLYVESLSNPRTAYQVGWTYDGNIGPAIGAKLAREVTTDDVMIILNGIASRGKLAMANRVRGIMRAAFQFGLTAPFDPQWSARAKAFGMTVNPVAATRAITGGNNVGERYLSEKEIADLWHSEADYLPALRLILSTGQRVEEVLGATWDEFDLEQRLWTIPASRRKSRGKVRHDHVVPLTDIHVEILESLPETGPYLFPGLSGERAMSHKTLNDAVRRLVKQGFLHFAPRDLRRTWKTQTGAAGLPLEIRNRIQGHGMTDVGSRNYDRWSYLREKQAAMAKWDRHLAAIIGRKAGKVVEMRR